MYEAAIARSHTTSIRVRYADVDRMGIAYNGVYLTWFEIGRTELLRNGGISYEDFENMGYRLPLTQTGIKFLKPPRYDDVIEVVSRVSSFNGVRMRIEYEVRRGDSLLATGFTEHVVTDKNIRPVRLPKDLRERIGGII